MDTMTEHMPQNQLRVLIAGCGYVGAVLAERLLEKGHEVFGLRRRMAALPPGTRLLTADLSQALSLGVLPDCIDAVCIMLSADAFEENAYRRAYIEGPANLLLALKSGTEPPRRVIFVSSTSVYHQEQGEWVDENSPAEPQGFPGRQLLDGERAIAGGEIPAVIVRLGGIYGPGRGRLIDEVRSGRATYPENGPVYTNRIHRDDAAGLLVHLLDLPKPEALYCGVDNEPADRRTVLEWLAQQTGAAPPQPGRSNETERLLRGNKRVSNRRLLDSGYVLRYPTFRQGYAELLATEEGAK
jgi:nucleoside-diphosphate-sugar epimerase